jgi:predicted ATPase
MQLGNNVSASLKGTILTVNVDLSKQIGESGSGKSTVIGSTQGNKRLDELGGSAAGISLGVNCYKKHNG